MKKSDYGLDSPDYTITYTAKDRTKGTIQIGNAARRQLLCNDRGFRMQCIPSSGTLVSDLVFDLSSLTENDTLPSISSENLKKVE